MSSFLEEIVKSNSSYDCKTESFTLVNQDKLESRIMDKMNSLEILNSDDGGRNLNTNIDDWMLYLKKNILEEFDGMKLILKDMSKNIIMNEVKRFENEMIQLKNCNIEYQNQISCLHHDVINYKGHIKSLSIKLSKNRNKFIEAKYMFNWRLRKEQADRKHFCEKLSDKFYQTNIMRKAFNGWKASLEISWKNRNNSKIERQAQSVCQQLVNEYEKQIIELRSEISKLQEENANMQTSRSATQDAVKKALMRGVCALNMETMSILNQNGIITTEKYGSNNNCFQNSPDFLKKHVPYFGNPDLADDQPRYSLNKFNRSQLPYNDNASYYSTADSVITGTDYNTDDVDSRKPNDISNIYMKTERSDYSMNNTQKMKPNAFNDNYAGTKSSLSRNSAITVQAGNPTGSHTHCSNSMLNISVRKHVNDTTPSSGNGYQSDYRPEKLNCKK